MKTAMSKNRPPSYQESELSEGYPPFGKYIKLALQKNVDFYARFHFDDECYDCVPLDGLVQKIAVALFGVDRDFDELNKVETKLVGALAEQITSLAETHRNSVDLAILEVYYMLSTEKNIFGRQVVFRVCLTNSEEARECVFVDDNCRVYKNWSCYLKKNMLHADRMWFLKNGSYDNRQVVELDVVSTRSDALECLDAISSLGVAGGCAVLSASLVWSFGTPAAMVAAASVAVAGGYEFLRTVCQLMDRSNHRQSLVLANEEARRLYMNAVLSGVCSLIAAKSVRQQTDLSLLPHEFLILGLKPLLSLVIPGRSSRCTSHRAVHTALDTVVQKIKRSSWSDVKSLRNLCCQIFNMYASKEEFESVMRRVNRLKDSLVGMAPHISYCLQLSMRSSLKSTKPSPARGADDLLKIIRIRNRFMVEMSLSKYQDIFECVRDSFGELLSRRIALGEFGRRVEAHWHKLLEDIIASWNEAKLEFDALYHPITCKEVFGREDVGGEELRKYFLQLEQTLLACEIYELSLELGGEESHRQPMKLLSDLVIKFLSKLDSNNCTKHGHSHFVGCACAIIKNEFISRYNKYVIELNFAKEIDPDTFDEDWFSMSRGIKPDVGTRMHFFLETIEYFTNRLGEMVEFYRSVLKDQKLVRGLPSLQSKEVKQYAFAEYGNELLGKPLENIDEERLWKIFRDLTGLTFIDSDNSTMEREGDNFILLQTSVPNEYMTCACFYLQKRRNDIYGAIYMYKQDY